MATTFTPKRGISSLFKKLALAAALGTCSIAQADIINFEDAPAFPFAFSEETYTLGNFQMVTLDDARQGDTVGMFINGADQADICQNLQCPTNNQTNYYASLNDSYFALFASNGGNFKINSMRGSFMGAGSSTFQAAFGILGLQGFGQNGERVGGLHQVFVPGKNALGGYEFSNLDLGLFSNNLYAAVQVLTFACDAGGNCFRNQGLANIAFDDIDATIPEPSTWALLGLGLLGMGAFSRKRAA